MATGRKIYAEPEVVSGISLPFGSRERVVMSPARFLALSDAEKRSIERTEIVLPRLGSRGGGGVAVVRPRAFGHAKFRTRRAQKVTGQ